MAWQSGPVPTLGITPSYLTQLGTATIQTGVGAAVGQVWQGAGQSFFGSAGQALVGNLAGSAVNIALNSTLGTQVAGPSGLNLTSGANLLASTITPYVTSSVAAGINQTIQQSLQSAGPFGAALSTLGTGLATQVFGGLTNSIFGGATSGLGSATNYKMFPGGGGEPNSDYGGVSYTLNDVVFSIQPANQGPQTFGLNQALNLPTSATTLPLTQLSVVPLGVGNATVDAAKQLSMGFTNTATSNLTLTGATTGNNFSSLNYGILR